MTDHPSSQPPLDPLLGKEGKATASDRLLWLDALRGLAVIGVIAIHGLAGALLFPSRYPFAGLLWLTFVDTVARYSVPCFLIASGLLLTLSHRRKPLSYPQFLRRRAWRVVPAYLFWSAIYTWPQHESPGLFGFLGNWARHSLIGDASFHTWYIPVILHLYLLHPLLAEAFGKLAADRRRAAWAIAVLVTLRLAMTRWWFGYGFLDGLPPLLASYFRAGPLAALEWAPYFLIGIAGAAWFDGEDETTLNLRWAASRSFWRRCYGSIFWRPRPTAIMPRNGPCWAGPRRPACWRRWAAWRCSAAWCSGPNWPTPPRSLPDSGRCPTASTSATSSYCRP